MTQTERTIHPFIQHLYTVAQREDRRILAALRRGLGKAPGAAPEMFPHVVPWLPGDLYRQDEIAYYTIASLFAYHPKVTASGNMGDHLVAAQTTGREDALERRFVALLSAHSDDLPNILRQSVSFLASKEIPINWDALFRDIRLWGHPIRGEDVRKSWATSFWRYRTTNTDQAQSE